MKQLFMIFLTITPSSCLLSKQQEEKVHEAEITKLFIESNVLSCYMVLF